MTTWKTLTAAALVTTLAATAAYAQTQRLRGTIQRVQDNLIFALGRDNAALTIQLPDTVAVTAVYKATLADIKEGDYIGSGASPQPDGSQKAIEVHIFAASMRGQGDGHRPWDGAPNSTMTNGAVGNIVTGVDGPIVLVKYKDGEKKIIVAATKQADGTFTATRINVGRDGGVPN